MKWILLDNKLGDFRGPLTVSGVARAFPGGRLAHPKGENEEENKLSFRKNWSQFE